MPMSMEELERREAELAAREAALREREAELPPKEPDERSSFQRGKENLYDKIPLNVHQVDAIIVVCIALLLGIFLTGILGIDPLAFLWH